MVPSLKAFGLAEFSKGQKNMGQSHSHPAWRGQSQIPLCPAAQVGPGERERSTPRRLGLAVSSVVLYQEGGAA